MIPRPKGMEERERSRSAQAYQIDRCRFSLRSVLEAEPDSTAMAMMISWDRGSSTWRGVTEIIVCNDNSGMFQGTEFLQGRAEFMPDTSRWEIYQLESECD